MSGLPLPVSKRIGGAVSAARNGKKATASLFENEPVQEGVILDNLHVAATATAVLISDSATVSGGQQHVADSSVVNTSPLVANRDTIITVARNADAVCAAPAPASSGSNRDRFMAHCQPMQVSCDLATVGMHNTSVRFSFQAVVLIVYPATSGPDRRHIQLIDRRGSPGITVWNDNVRLFSSDSVGQGVQFP